MTEGVVAADVLGLIRPYVKNQEALATANPETNLFDDLGINSARIVDVVLAVEDRYDIEIDDDSVDWLLTLGDLMKIIEEKKRGGGG